MVDRFVLSTDGEADLQAGWVKSKRSERSFYILSRDMF